MKPYGQSGKVKHNLKDNRLVPKRLGNWWEEECKSVEKTRARQQAKREITKTLEEDNEKESKTVIIEDCRYCEHYFLLTKYCKLFAMKTGTVTAKQRKHCFTFNEEKEVERIENKEW